LTNPFFPLQFTSHAGVAELADALRSGRSGRKAIWVQLPASAQARVTGLSLFFSRLRGEMPSDRKVVPSAGVHRRDNELPPVTVREGWRFHHVGIPTGTPRPGEEYLPQYGFYHSGFGTSAYGIEWMRFEDSSPLPEIIRTVPHIAFVVDDLEAALLGRDILFDISAPSPGVRTAMILADGAPIELMEFVKGTAP
jgi:hypothetical protein